MTEQAGDLDVGQPERERVRGQRVSKVVQADRLLAVDDEARVLGRDLQRTERVPPAGRVAPRGLEDERVALDAVEALRGLPLDGSYETDNGPNPRRSTRFAHRGDHLLRVRVTDVAGLSSETSAVVHVTPAPPGGALGVSINDGAIATNDPNVTVSLVWPRLAETALISNDGGFGAADGTRSFALKEKLNWTLQSSGPERMPKIVYVRFRGGESGRETYTDDIILDQRPPQVAATSLVSANAFRTLASASVERPSSVLSVTGKDDNAGIGSLTVAAKPGGKAIATKRLARPRARGQRKAKTTLRFSSRLRKVYVRVSDVAGNRSR